MGASDPTYPLYPIASVLAATMLLLVLLSSFVRQSWNLGVTFLCFWLFLENLNNAVNAIIWSDNADIKLYVYCDIVSHLNVITYIVKPMTTLVITRRLYLLTSHQSVDFPSKAARRRNLAIEWTLGLFVPLLVAGPIYYVHQGGRFTISEVAGCSSDVQTSVLELLTMDSWAVIPPIISIIFFYPKVVRLFYRQSRDAHSFLNSNPSVSRTNYLRILALASMDILLTLPIGIMTIVLRIVSLLAERPLAFYWGWTFLHTDWEPVSITYEDIKATGAPNLAQFYFTQWTSPVLAFTIFGLFGLTSEARASYWRVVCTVGGWVGWKPTPRKRNGLESLGEIELGERPQQDLSLGDLEMGSRRTSLMTWESPVAKQDPEHTLDAFEASESGPESIVEALRSASNVEKINDA